MLEVNTQQLWLKVNVRFAFSLCTVNVHLQLSKIFVDKHLTQFTTLVYN